MDDQVSLSAVLSHEEIKALLSPAQERDAWRASFMKTEVCPVSSGSLKLFTHIAQSLTAVFKEKAASPFVSFSQPYIQEMLLNEYQKQLMSDMCILPFKMAEDVGLLVCDSDLAYALLDMMLGGRRGLGSLHKDSYTHIERNVLQEQMRAMLSAISATLNVPLRKGTHLLAASDILMRCSPDRKLIGEYRVRLDQIEGRLALVLPLSARTICDRFEQETAATPMSKAVAKHIQHVCVELSAVLKQKDVPFRKLFGWKKGQFLALDKDKKIVVQCEHVPLFEGKLNAQKDGVIIDKGTMGRK